jgi:hemoglobin/transferrin/lactoferrin receptor protein
MNKSHPAVAMLAALTAFLGQAATANENSGAPAMSEVIVTATYQDRRADEIAGTVSVISAEQLNRTLSDDLADAIRYQPGIVMDTANRGGNEGMRIRGIGGNRVLTVIDGIRSADMYAAGPSSYGKDSYEVDDLKAVEIIRGPASVLYGADALGGVVVLRTKDASDYLSGSETFYSALRTSGSSINNQLKAGLTLAQQTGKLGNVLQLTRRDFEESDVNGPGQRNPQAGDNQSLFAKSRWDINDKHALTISAERFDEAINTVLEDELSSSVSLSQGRDLTDRQRLSLRHDWLLGHWLADSLSTHLNWQSTNADQQTIQLRTSFSFVNPRNPASFRGTQAERYTSLEFNQTTRSAMVLARRQNLIYGASLEQTDTERPRDRFDTRSDTGASSRQIASYPMAAPEVFPNKTFPDTRTRRQGVFAQYEMALLDGRLMIMPGLRYDHYRMDPDASSLVSNTGDISDWGGFSVQRFSEDNISANLGMLYDINSSLSVFAQYAEGFRPPNFDEANQAFVNLGHGYATIPNPDVRAETSQAYEAGLRVSLNNGSLSVAAFDNHYEDFIESNLLAVQNGIMLFQDSNIGKARIYGLEASSEWQLSDQLSWQSSLSWSRGRNQVSNNELNSVDPFTAVTGLRYRVNDRLSVEGIATLVAAKTRVESDDQVHGKAYQVLDLMGSYQILPSANIRFGVFNLLDAKYAPWGRIAGLTQDDAQTVANNQAAGINARLALDFTF